MIILKGKAFVGMPQTIKTINVNTLHEVIIQYLFLNSYLTNVIKKVGWKNHILLTISYKWEILKLVGEIMNFISR